MMVTRYLPRATSPPAYAKGAFVRSAASSSDTKYTCFIENFLSVRFFPSLVLRIVILYQNRITWNHGDEIFAWCKCTKVRLTSRVRAGGRDDIAAFCRNAPARWGTRRCPFARFA